MAPSLPRIRGQACLLLQGHTPLPPPRTVPSATSPACLPAQGFLQARVPSPAHLLPWHLHQEVVRHPWPPPLSVLGLKRRGAAVPAWPPRRPSLLACSPCASSGTPGSTAQNRGGGGGSREGQASGWSPGGWPWLVASIGQSPMPGASHRPLHPVCPGLAALVCAAALGPPGVSADPRSVVKAGGLEHIHGPPASAPPLGDGGGPESTLIPPALPHPPSRPPAPPLPSLSAVTETELLTPVGVSIGLDFTSSAPAPPSCSPSRA